MSGRREGGGVKPSKIPQGQPTAERRTMQTQTHQREHRSRHTQTNLWLHARTSAP